MRQGASFDCRNLLEILGAKHSYDVKPADHENLCESRAIVLRSTFYKLGSASYLYANLSTPVSKCVPRRICYELVHNHSQSPAPIRLQLQRRCRHDEIYFHVIELRSADRLAEVFKICRRVDVCAAF